MGWEGEGEKKQEEEEKKRQTHTGGYNLVFPVLSEMPIVFQGNSFSAHVH